MTKAKEPGKLLTGSFDTTSGPGPPMQQPFARSLLQWGPNASCSRPPTLAEAQAYCRQLARSHYENFTVVSWLLPRGLRQDFCNIYAYCRWADDLADETRDPAQSASLLTWWEQQLLAGYEQPRVAQKHPVFVALQETIRNYQIPLDPFRDLISAFQQDQQVVRYQDSQAVLDYCRRSANPVGHLILYLGCVTDAESQQLSDHICTGLQLANFCQDVANDWDRGRVYLPQSTLQEAGYTEANFRRREFNPAFREVMRIEVDRAENHLRWGQPLIERMPHELKFDVSLFAAGGLAILDAIRKQDYDVWKKRPTLSKTKKLTIVLKQWQGMHKPFSTLPRNELQTSYALCRKIARQSASNFAWAFWLLPKTKRLAMYALYAFLRHTDDLGDNAQPPAERQRNLHNWRGALQDALDGKPRQGIFPAVADMVRRFSVPPSHLTDVIDGVLMDCVVPEFHRSRFQTFAELERYCELVASAVGMACIHIWGFTSTDAIEPARQCGVALQLTNILRDLRQDAAEGRIYLPAEDLAATGYTIDELRRGVQSERFIRLMQLEITRAEAYYQYAEKLNAYLDPAGQRICGAMVDTYRGLLGKMKQCETDVLEHRVHLGRYHKLRIALQWLLTRPQPGLVRRNAKPRSGALS